MVDSKDEMQMTEEQIKDYAERALNAYRYVLKAASLLNDEHKDLNIDDLLKDVDDDKKVALALSALSEPQTLMSIKEVLAWTLDMVELIKTAKDPDDLQDKLTEMMEDNIADLENEQDELVSFLTKKTKAC